MEYDIAKWIILLREEVRWVFLHRVVDERSFFFYLAFIHSQVQLILRVKDGVRPF